MKAFLIAVFLLISGPSQAWGLKGDLPGLDNREPTPQQLLLQCRYESNLVRGITSVIQLLQHTTGITDEQVPIDYMKQYIGQFYNEKDQNEIQAAYSAFKVLDWIYLKEVTDPKEGEIQYFKECNYLMGIEDTETTF